MKIIRSKKGFDFSNGGIPSPIFEDETMVSFPIACKPDGYWLRYTGKVVFETDSKYAEASLEAMPHLKDIYNEQTGKKKMMFHLKDATAVDINMMGEAENLLD